MQLNYFPYQGGIDLYVKQTLGPGLQNETFYSNNDPDGPKAAYKNWVRAPTRCLKRHV